FPELLYSGFLQEAEKELSEAAITLSIIGRREIPKPEDIDVSYNSYLHGLGEAVGELRRYVLDLIRRGEDGGEEILDTMEEIYLALTQMDFPDAITGGLRRTTDNVRGIIERTRGDLSLYIAQRRLERKLERG
ncbi:MAG: haloacid dehalogenase, partial [Thermoplasmata archaeon]